MDEKSEQEAFEEELRIERNRESEENYPNPDDEDDEWLADDGEDWPEEREDC